MKPFDAQSDNQNRNQVVYEPHDQIAGNLALMTTVRRGKGEMPVRQEMEYRRHKIGQADSPDVREFKNCIRKPHDEKVDGRGRCADQSKFGKGKEVRIWRWGCVAR